MVRRGATAHPDDETLSDLIDDTVSADAKVRQHVERCDLCRGRVEELAALRRLLHDAGAREAAPPGDLTGLVIGRLRMRHSAIGSMNEVLAAVRALLAGISSLLGGKPAPDDAGRSESLPHG